MNAKGMWYATENWQRCNGRYLCWVCALDRDATPHGPYIVLRRRHPETGKKDKAVYIGRVTREASAVAQIVNEKWGGTAVVPTREDVLALVRESRS